MKQERLIKSLEFIERVIDRAERTPVEIANGRSAYLTKYAAIMSKQALQIYRPIRHALNKAIEKPARKDGNRALCPDCRTTVRKKDNYCRICGQRLKMQQKEEKPFYEKLNQKKRKGKNENGKKG